MTGRKPKPIALKIAEGDTRKVGAKKLQQRLAAEPKAASGLPPCPRHLRYRGRAAWVFWAEELRCMNLDCRPDAVMLEGACVNYARAVKADLILQREGLMVEDCAIDPETGKKLVLKVKYHPAITVSNAAWRQVRAFCSEFGLSPVSRTRLTIEKADTGEQDLLALLSQPRTPRPKPDSVQ